MSKDYQLHKEEYFQDIERDWQKLYSRGRDGGRNA
jgi:hypothetical protein